MTMMVMKHGGKWEKFARIFQGKGPSFERLITSFVRIISPFTYQFLAIEASKAPTMETMIENKQSFSKFKCARYTTDVKFQQSFPSSEDVA